jgi:hypothetical protein
MLSTPLLERVAGNKPPPVPVDTHLGCRDVDVEVERGEHQEELVEL